MEIGSCAVLVAFLCALFYTTFYYLFLNKTSVNAKPFSPPSVFEEIAAHDKKTNIFLIGVFAFASSL